MSAKVQELRNDKQIEKETGSKRKENVNLVNEGESKQTNDQPDTGMSEEQKDKGQSEPMLDSMLHEIT